MQVIKKAFKEAALVFILSRLLIILLSCISIFILPQYIPIVRQQLALAPPYTHNPFTLHSYLYSWFRWDVKAFVNISHNGYRHPPDVAFFPLWPLLQHAGAFLFGGHFPDAYYYAGLLLSNLCFYVALVLLYILLSNDLEQAIARRSLYYFAFSPFALFFFAGYSESLFVMLCIAVFLLIRRGTALDWWLAGLLGFLATLTRSTGLLLIVPFLTVYVQRFWLCPQAEQKNWLKKLNALVPVILIPAAVLVYMVYLYYTKGDPLIFKIQEEATWGRQFSLPWDTIALMYNALVKAPSIIIVLENLLNDVFALAPLVALVVGWRTIPLHYRLFVFMLAAFTLSFPAALNIPMYSQPRFMLVAFPLAAIFAFWGKKNTVHLWIMALSLLLFSLNVLVFTANFWVA